MGSPEPATDEQPPSEMPAPASNVTVLEGIGTTVQEVGLETGIYKVTMQIQENAQYGIAWPFRVSLDGAQYGHVTLTDLEKVVGWAGQVVVRVGGDDAEISQGYVLVSVAAAPPAKWAVIFAPET